ncbi:hypothetical protein SOMG_00059 [Schizosaccharomyces osmophilus]|uniref:Uncharacterized protein n=1 Tax=Schizosaccharomyces osmophilus TaxID=2545709 RepID=A0AAE9W7L7_9SCHI|nr:uncharacterized protein SOMG_00059 [Schizosaccharomyces osmophilus]WBW71340.1 hypothetical protein SOMG_00059 [Schizosaccharomyces osmophilus]
MARNQGIIYFKIDLFLLLTKNGSFHENNASKLLQLSFLTTFFTRNKAYYSLLYKTTVYAKIFILKVLLVAKDFVKTTYGKARWTDGLATELKHYSSI